VTFVVALLNLEEHPYLETMNFVEQSLVYTFESLLKQNGQIDDIFLKELDCWQGRADLVHVNIRNNQDIKVEKAFKMANLSNAQILSLLHHNSSRTFSYIKNRLGITEATIKRSIRDLINSGVITTNDSGNFLLHKEFNIPDIVFTAYEAKLHNWKRALYQAIQYYGFAQYSWVVMPEKFIRPALSNINSFEANGIGLIGVDDSGYYKIYLKAKKNRPSKKAFHLVGIGKTYLALN
jgi:hypothetical protein